MIKTRKDLRSYIEQDLKQNLVRLGGQKDGFTSMQILGFISFII